MSKSTKTTARRSSQTGTFEIIQRAEKSWPLRILSGAVRLRVELTTVAVIITAWALLDARVAPGLGAWAVLGVLALAVAAIPHSRRFVYRRAWSVFARHRLRTCLVNRRVMTYEGLVPRMLWSRPIPVGVRIWVFLRAGLAASHLERVTEEIASTCWARDARVTVHGKWTALVRVDVVYRDPLSARGEIASDLLSGHDPATNSGADVIPLPDRATVRPTKPATTREGVESAATGDAQTVSARSAPATTAKATTRTTSRSNGSTDDDRSEPPAALGRSGEDVSDYV
ncbi:MAG: hypothetical protein GEV09_08325 [Pseudonocardiaceae bacterium]|nr:hypothetical protein [Pseudonocardiaceae bacterium]